MTHAYDDVIAFHGHSCPGLAIGYRMATAAIAQLSEARAVDEELVAIVENDACGVDALQFVTGCTFGKGNLVFKDYGKQVYTLYFRKSKKGVRVVFHPKNMPESIGGNREKFAEWLRSAPEEDVVSVEEVSISEPERARIMASVTCEFCGEGMMKTRAKKIGGKLACIPCAEKM